MAFPDLDPNQAASQEMAERVARRETARAQMAGKPLPGASVQTAPLPGAGAKPAPSAVMPKNPLLDAAKAPPPKPVATVTPAAPVTPAPAVPSGPAAVEATGLGRGGAPAPGAAPAVRSVAPAPQTPTPLSGPAAKAGLSKAGLVGGALVEGLNTYDDIARTPGAGSLLQAGRVAEGAGKVAGAALGATAGAAVGGPLAPLTGLVGGVAGYFAPEMVAKAANFAREKSNQYLGTDIPEFQLSSQRMADIRGETPAPAAIPAAAAKPAAAQPVGINGTLPPERPIPPGMSPGTGGADFNAGNQSVTAAGGLTPSAVAAGNANLRANLKDGSGQHGSLGTYGDGSTSEQAVARINADTAALQGLHQAQMEAAGYGRRSYQVASPSLSPQRDGGSDRKATKLTIDDLRRMTPQMRDAALRLMEIEQGGATAANNRDASTQNAMQQAEAAAANTQARAEQDAAQADAEAGRRASDQAVEMLKLRKPQVMDQYDSDGNKIGQILVDPFTGRPINQMPQAPGLADGGYVDPRLGAPGTDTIPAAVRGKPIRLDGGEYVLPADTTQAIGRQALDATVAATHQPKRAARNGAANGGLMASLFQQNSGLLGNAARAIGGRTAQIDRAVDGAVAPPPKPAPPPPAPPAGGQSMADIMREIRAKNPAY